MDNTTSGPKPNIGGRREPSIEPVKAQGILTELNRKEKNATLLWRQRWGFYNNVRQMQEEEAQKIGMSLQEYRAGIKSLNCHAETKQYPVVVDPSPTPLPITSSGMIGRRSSCPLERYGSRLVKTSRDYPLRPPLPPGQIYDPYKQTMVFLGIDCGDPISYKLRPARCEVTDDMWAKPHNYTVSPLSHDYLLRVANLHL